MPPRKLTVVDTKAQVPSTMPEAPLPAPLPTQAPSGGSIPFMSMLQGLSPAVQNNPRKFVQGEYYHHFTEESLGEDIRVCVLWYRPTYVLWPGGKDGTNKPLAKSLDGLVFRPQHTEFSTRLDTGKIVKWNTRGSVDESGLARWGSSDPSDKNSKPAAKETWEFFLYLVDRPELSPSILSFKSTGIKLANRLITLTRMIQGMPYYAGVFDFGSQSETKNGKTWFNPVIRRSTSVLDAETIQKVGEMHHFVKAYSDAQIEAWRRGELDGEDASELPEEGGKGGAVPF